MWGRNWRLAGADVSLVARGPHLKAMRENGLRLRIGGEEKVARVTATDDPAELGPQECVFVALKAHSIPGVVDRDDVAARQRHQHRHRGERHPVLVLSTSTAAGWPAPPSNPSTPAASQWEKLRPERAIGCVVFPATEVVEPGVIGHIYGDKFPLGEPGRREDRAGARRSSKP